MSPEARPPKELRLAVVMTGGVSLAIWMGGVAWRSTSSSALPMSR